MIYFYVETGIKKVITFIFRQNENIRLSKYLVVIMIKIILVIDDLNAIFNHILNIILLVKKYILFIIIKWVIKIIKLYLKCD